jgi:hypothetical protein
MSDGIQSKIKIYWRVWFFATAILFAFRFTIFLHASENAIFILFVIYAAPTWLAIMILYIYQGNRLLKYLERNHKEKWGYLDYPKYFCRGLYGFRYLPFSKEDLGDQAVIDFKNDYKKLINFSIIVFLSYPVIFLAIMLPLKSLTSAS